MTIYLGHHGGEKQTSLSACSKAVYGCVAPEEDNDLPTLDGHGQTKITLAGILARIGDAAVKKLAIDDIITTNLVPTNSYIEGVGFTGGIACGYEFEFVAIRQNGLTATGEVNFDIAPLSDGALNITTFATVSGVTTATVAASDGAPPQIGAAATQLIYSPKHNAEYFGSFGAIGIKLKAVPAAATSCDSSACGACGKCEMFSLTYRNIQHCVTCGTGCGTNSVDVMKLA
jgi:hypothetical protein